MNWTALWELEKRFWLEGLPVYEAHLSDQILMVFPGVGIMGRDAVLESIRGAPRWQVAEMSEQHEAEAGDTVVLAYAVDASNKSRDSYRAFCSSTYVRADHGWRMISHQQTPRTGE